MDPTVAKNQWLDLSLSLSITNSGTYALRALVMGGNNGTSSCDVFFDSISAWKPDGTPGYVAKAVGIADHSDLDFMQSNYVGTAFDLDTMTATSFPKELNLGWWITQSFYLSLEAAQASHNLLLTLDSHWNSGTGSLMIAADIYTNSQWVGIGTAAVNSVVSGVITIPAARLHTGRNDFRIRAVSGSGGTETVTWDQITLLSEGIESPVFDVTLGVRYCGYAGGSATNLNYPAYVETIFGGWQFRRLSNGVPAAVTNRILLREMPDRGPAFIEFDQYAYVDKFAHTERGEPLDISNSAPFFVLGTRNESSSEFGSGPFNPVHTYVVGTSLTNFPRRMTTDGSGGWPSELRLVFQQNFTGHSLSRDMYCVLATVSTNGSGSNLKNVEIALDAVEPAGTNVSIRSAQIPMGWASETQSWGKVDSPNVTAGDHGSVGFRNSGRYGLADDSGWFVQQFPRGSTEIAPMTLYTLKDGSWVQRMYEEYFFLWPNAASGVRSIFDDDSHTRLEGPASYHVSFRMGHSYGTNEFGEPAYQLLLESKGNAQWQMADLGGQLMGGLRPVAANLQALQGPEHPFLTPDAYVQIVPRTTPTNQADNSFARAYMQARSATNQSFIGAIKGDFHFAPDEVASTGAYADIEQDLWAKSAWSAGQNGKLALFSQRGMHVSGDLQPAVNATSEMHSVDVVMIQKQDGEWITHHVLNPSANTFRRRLGSFATGDVLYAQQQDRGLLSYGSWPGSYLQKASSFEFSFLELPTQSLGIDIIEQHSEAEASNNVDVACVVDDDLAATERVHYRYRYRAVYGPSVTIVSPNQTSGGDLWISNRIYRLEALATDGDSTLQSPLPLRVSFYYGNGQDAGWQLINGSPLVVTDASHKATFDWNVAAITQGAYYVKAVVSTGVTGKTGFDISNTRLQIGGVQGFARNGTLIINSTTNGRPYLGNDMGFEAGTNIPWNASHTNWNDGTPDLVISTTNALAYEGTRALRWTGQWAGSSWNSIWQDIPCISGEVLQVSARVHVKALTAGPAVMLKLGIKVESTNGLTYTSDGAEYEATTLTTGEWFEVGFERRPNSTGFDRLQIFAFGAGCTNLDIYFDDIRVLSTNTGSIHVETIQQEYWKGFANVTNDDRLSLWVSGTNNTGALSWWVKDTNGTTRSVPLTNFVARLLTVPQRVLIPWTNFAINRSKLSSMGYAPNSSDQSDARITDVQSLYAPLRGAGAVSGAPAADFEGLSMFNPGQVVTHIITITNTSAVAVSGLTVRAVQEYAETRTWTYTPPSGKARALAETRRGDRLCGAVEQIWSNRSIAARSRLTLTNVYALPLGTQVVQRTPDGTIWNSFYVDRSRQARAQVHLVVRTTGGLALLDSDQIAVYAMDDDFDIDNDGLPDWWETQYFGDRTVAEPDDDPDDDGFTNQQEFDAGTDPTDPLSHPEKLFPLTVTGNPGDFGTPAPYGYGTHQIISGQVVSIAVPSRALEAADIRHNALGWTGAGSVPVSGVGTQVTFTVRTNSTLTWNWDTENALNQWMEFPGSRSEIFEGSEERLARTNSAFGTLGSAVAVNGSLCALAVNGADGAYLFREAGDTWSQEARVVGNDPAFGDQLASVALFGNTLVAGCPADDDHGSASGSAYVFSRTGTVWTQQAKLSPSDLVAADEFGWAVAVESNRALIGMPGPYYGVHPGAA